MIWGEPTAAVAFSFVSFTFTMATTLRSINLLSKRGWIVSHPGAKLGRAISLPGRLHGLLQHLRRRIHQYCLRLCAMSRLHPCQVAIFPKHKSLDWEKRFSITMGSARAILYLHQDSRLNIIHLF
ncbi:hypothetical protein EJ110_NYTH29255 [Nymphaea thermarum]|nr:hypothetical protein EJ110_NYTH29255 [Nymphaea thermarum]